MRPFEALLLTAELLVIVLLSAGPPGASRWTRRLPLALLAIAAAQVLIEGPRWQMGPAYALAGLLGLPRLKRARSGWLAAAAVLPATSLALSLALPVFRLPDPGGPLAIGTLTYHWIDAGRAEALGSDPAALREMMAQVWYPAAPSGPPDAPYVEDAGALWAAQARLHGLPAGVLSYLGYAMSHASSSAPVAGDKSAYPVLVFLEGLTGFRQMSGFQVEALVSQGYVVVALDQPPVAAVVTFPDGRSVPGLTKAAIDGLIQQSIEPTAEAPMFGGVPFANGIIPYLAQDVGFALDQIAILNASDRILAGRLDLTAVGAFGVSSGGIVVGEACLTEPRLRACLIMDAPMTADVVRSGLPRPTMWITRDAATMRREGWSKADIAQHLVTMRAAFEGTAGGVFVEVPGMFHANLTDAPLLSPLLPWLGVTGPIDGARAHAIVNAYTLAFFDRHLRSEAAPLLDGPSHLYPEVRAETRS